MQAEQLGQFTATAPLKPVGQLIVKPRQLQVHTDWAMALSVLIRTAAMMLIAKIIKNSEIINLFMLDLPWLSIFTTDPTKA